MGVVSGRLSDDSRSLVRRGEVSRRHQYSSSLCSGGRGDHPFFLPGMNSMVEVDMMKCDISSSEVSGIYLFFSLLIGITSIRWITTFFSQITDHDLPYRLTSM